ncbi:MAG: hypothetical protein J7D60_11105, partial [Prosthecochloris sp.]|nr:hypothetical protein [Prosthecochloris sp.]
MRIISNPRRNIRLSQLKDCRRGFISSSDVKAIKGNKRFNMAINLNALVYSVKSDNAFIPVFGTGEDKVQFEIDLSSFVIDESESVDFESLKKDTKDDWYEIKADILDNVLFDDLDFEDESFENYFDDWIVFTKHERKELLIEIEEFLLK